MDNEDISVPESLEQPDTAPQPEQEPTPELAKPVRKSTRKPKAAAPYAVVGPGPRDDVVLSKAVPLAQARTRKSLTVHHLQRRLTELGYPEAYADLDGQYGKLTKRAVTQWQDENGYPATGLLDAEQFEAIFEDDPNVNIKLN